jgi:hypothetical protein
MTADNALTAMGVLWVLVALMTFPSPTNGKYEFLAVYLTRIGISKSKQLLSYLGSVL